MSQAKWIWYPGDYEIYHSNLVHSRREDFNLPYVSMWMQYTPYPRINFSKEINCPEARSIRVLTNADTTGFVALSGGRTMLPLNTTIEIPAGTNQVVLRLCNIKGGISSAYIDDEYYGTDESWKVSNGSANYVSAACEPAYTDPKVTPDTFLFSYDELTPVSVKKVDDGILYDFGRESFGPVAISHIDPQETLYVCYGESLEEALDWENAYLKQIVSGTQEIQMVPRAFRYIHVRSTLKESGAELTAQYEYLPLKDIGKFACDDPMIEKIWDVCAYTFHLNSREFYQDAIKRDRWVWSGDSYQSYMINNYLYMDPAITRRTIYALIGKPPYEQHINTINDYTLYQLIGLWEYYFATGDLKFVQQIWPRIKSLYDFTQNRLDEDGQVVKRTGDWIFVDWSPMDKDGPLCTEQILLWQANNCMAKLATLCGESPDLYAERAAHLKELINERYWDEEKCAYIDTYASGKRNVTRHANIFAILYDFVDEDRKKLLMDHVLKNDEITQITTPYFKFYELCARCSMGDLATAQELLSSYWGGMLKDGATSVWEQYDPNAKGIEHYAMYGFKFGCSLCHAWGAGPIYFLGRYCLGVRADDVAYSRFTVEPQLGVYQEISGTVPLPNGKVDVQYKNGVLTVASDCSGGTVVAAGKSYALKAGEPLVVHCTL